MTAWLPQIAVRGWTSAEDWGAYEGSSLTFEWLGCIAEIAVARGDDLPTIDWRRLGRFVQSTLLTVAIIAYLLADGTAAYLAWCDR